MEISEEQKLYETIVQKAWEDTKFKSNLMANPKETIETFTGKKLNLPQGKTLIICDQTDEGTVYVNIPAKSNTEDVELNEEQLEVVAGGTCIPGFSIKWPTLPIIIELL